MEKFFNIQYEFQPETAHKCIEEHITRGEPGYICVADGVILSKTYRDAEYLNIINRAICTICDSSFVPLYIKRIYGLNRKQYCGSDIFEDIIRGGKYRMIFLGSSRHTLDGLQQNIAIWNSEVLNMQFIELPFAEIDAFDYPAIARMVEQDGADIIWVALGAPKQEYFMARLLPYLRHGVIIAVGAVFNFYGDSGYRRAPRWVRKAHLEFLYRIWKEPRKQLHRCRDILLTLPPLLYTEWRHRRTKLSN